MSSRLLACISSMRPQRSFLSRVEFNKRIASVQHARIDAAEGDGADERVVHDLERQQRQRLGIAGWADQFLFRIVHIHALDRRAVERARQIIDDSVEQGLHALVLERRAEQHRIPGGIQHRQADQPLQRRDVWLVAIQIGGHHVVVHLDGGFDQSGPIFDRLLFQVVGNFDDVELRAEAFVLPEDRVHLDQIDQALEAGFDADRQLQRHRTRAQALLDVVDADVKIGADLIHLVGEDDARHFVLVALAPDGFGLRLHALVAVEHHHRAVEHAQGALHLDGEIDVAGRVDDVEPLAFQNVVVAADVMVMPRSCSCSIQSMVAAPSWTSPILWLLPE